MGRIVVSAARSTGGRPNSSRAELRRLTPILRPQALPVALTSFVGREREAAAVADLLRTDGSRLVTLTGPGGVGKTRLALRVADELASAFPDGAVFVALASVSDADLVLPTIAHGLGVPNGGGLPVAVRLTGVLRDTQLLLVLDNFEHVVEAGPAVADLLRTCVGLRALVTSRTLLHVSGEQNYPLQPLSVPEETDSLERVAGAAAVRLFAQRARAADPGFDVTSENASTIAAVCRRLEGLPLALELAAAKIGLLSPPALLGRLERPLSVLTGGARDVLPRLRTMRDAVAWSHDLLPEDQQVLFRRLAVFVGGFDLEAADAVAARDGAAGIDVATGVDALAEASLLRTARGEAGEAVRLTMLETTREFGLERLAAAGEEEQTRQAHADHYFALAERAEQDLLGPTPEAWLARLAADHGNLTAALTWFAERDASACAGLAAALRDYWYESGRWREGRRWLEPAVAQAAALPDRIAAKAFVASGYLAHYQGDDASALPLLERGLVVLRHLGDERAEAYAQYLLGIAAEDRGDYAAATELLAEAGRRLRSLGHAANAAFAEAHLGIVALGESDPARARVHGDAARMLAAEAGASGPDVAVLLLGDVARDVGELATAAERYREYLELTAGRGGSEDLARAVAAVAVLAVERGQPEGAARLFGAGERLRETLGLALAQPERSVCERASARALGELGEERFGKALTEGRALAPHEALLAVEEALGLRPPVAESNETAPAGLSPRESEVLRLIATGRTNREIAQTLFLSVRTVERHVTNLYAKIGARGRADATAFALRHGLA